MTVTVIRNSNSENHIRFVTAQYLTEYVNPSLNSVTSRYARPTVDVTGLDVLLHPCNRMFVRLCYTRGPARHGLERTQDRCVV